MSKTEKQRSQSTHETEDKVNDFNCETLENRDAPKVVGGNIGDTSLRRLGDDISIVDPSAS